MATLFTEQRKTEMYQFFAVAFSAAPGTVYLQQLREAVESGLTTKAIVNVFTQKQQFTDVYSPFLSNQVFATNIVNNVIKNSADAAAKQAAVNDIVSALASGLSRGDVIFNVFGNLASRVTNPNSPNYNANDPYLNVARQFENSIIVARYYTEGLNGAAIDVPTLQSVIRNVTDTSDVSSPTAIQQIIDSGAELGQTFLLSDIANTIAGTSGNDSIQGTTTTFQSLDSINGAAGRDVLTVLQANPNAEANLLDTAFQNTRNVEILQFDAGNTGRTVNLGTNASSTSLDTVIIAGAGGIANIVGYTRTLTVIGNTGVDEVRHDIQNAGVKRFDLGSQPNVLDRVVVSNSGVNQVRLSFTSAEVGNGLTGDGNDTAAAPGAGVATPLAYAGVEDGGLAVRIEREDVNGRITGETGVFPGQLTHRSDDEGVVFTGATFDVRDLGTGAARGLFTGVALGTSGADVIAATDVLGVGTTAVYINAGAGNDSLTGSSAADFLVGGTGDDDIVTNGGNDTVIAGAGSDVITATAAAGLVNLDGGTGDDTFVLTDTLNAAGLAVTRDSLVGGDGRDTLAAGGKDFTASTPAAVGETTTISGVETLRVVDNELVSLVTTNVASGVDTLVFAEQDSGGQITFESGTRTVQISTGNTAGSLGASLTGTAAGVSNADVLQVLNRNTNAVLGLGNALGGQDLTAANYETLLIDTGNVASTVQTTGLITVNANTVSTATNLNVTGVNALAIASATTNSSGVFTINASTLAAQAKGVTFAVSVAASPAGGRASVVGSAGDDVVSVDSAGFVNGGTGADLITGSVGNDTLLGGAGTDTIITNAGNDSVDGGDGDDLVVVGSSLTQNDTVTGGAARDTLAVSAAVTAAQQTNLSAFELLRFDAGATQSMAVFGSANAFDTVVVNTGATVAVQDASASLNTVRFDVTASTLAFDRLFNTAKDTLSVSAGGATPVTVALLTLNNTVGLLATGGEDVLNVTQGAAISIEKLVASDLDAINISGSQATSIGAGAGNGVTLGAARAIAVNASASTGPVTLDVSRDATGAAVTTAFTLNFTGSSKANTVTAFAGNDSIVGGVSADILNGGAGNDTISGLDGADVITGGAGADLITLGAGADTLVFTSLVGGADTIADYSVLDDSIQLSKAAFAALGAVGALTAAEFASGADATAITAAATAATRITYNTTTGALSYDADGTGAGVVAVLIGTFTGAPALVFGEFTIIA